MSVLWWQQLSEKQREEMRRLRDEAAAHTVQFRDDPRMAYIQTILHSVQVI